VPHRHHYQRRLPPRLCTTVLHRRIFTSARGHLGESTRLPSLVDAPGLRAGEERAERRAAAPPLVRLAFVPSWDLSCRCRCLHRRAPHSRPSHPVSPLAAVCSESFAFAITFVPAFVLAFVPAFARAARSPDAPRRRAPQHAHAPVSGASLSLGLSSLVGRRRRVRPVHAAAASLWPRASCAVAKGGEARPIPWPPRTPVPDRP
jgi:hypothetical protein